MRFNGLHRVCNFAGMPVTLSPPPLAAAIADTVSSSPEWTFTAGTEYGRDKSRGSSMSVDYSGHADTGAVESSSHRGQVAFGVSGLHTDTPTASASDSSTAFGWGINVNVSTRQTHFDGFPINGSEVARRIKRSRLTATQTARYTTSATAGPLTYTVGSWSARSSFQVFFFFFA